METIQNTPISEIELSNILLEVKNPTMLSMLVRVPVNMNQYLDYWIINEEGKKKKNPNPTPNPYYEQGIHSVRRMYKIITGFDYQDSVNGRLVREGKEGNFESEKPVWFKFLSKGLVTDQKTESKFYLRYQYLNDSILEGHYEFNGNEIEKQMFESFMVKVSNEYDKQGLDNTLNFQVVSLKNILEISINKQKYEVIH